MTKCEREECEVTYQKKTHNQKYCSSECCRLATNKRIMAKYYAKQALRRGKVRYCDTCEITQLSRYNDSTTCASCSMRAKEEERKTVAGMLSAISWQV